MSDPKYIYHIIGVGGVIKYVGCTVCPANRWSNHWSKARMRVLVSTAAIQAWMNLEEAEGRIPVMRVVRKAKPDWRADERQEIRRLLAEGQPLLNTCVEGMPMFNRAASRAESEYYSRQLPEPVRLCPMLSHPPSEIVWLV